MESYSRALAGVVPAGPPLGVGAVQDEMGNPLRMAGGVADALGRALRNAEQRERRPAARRVDHCLEVGQLPVERQIRGVPVGHPAAALVVAHEPEVSREELHPVTPDRALPLVFEMAQPVRRLDDGGAGAGLGPRQPDTVARSQETDALGGHLSHWLPRILVLRGRNRDRVPIADSGSKPDTTSRGATLR